ncbi:hypothetical protein [Nostoc edaphicum]|nr:hypothetical protein [Nostoc edaphicum]
MRLLLFFTQHSLLITHYSALSTQHCLGDRSSDRSFYFNFEEIALKFM